MNADWVAASVRARSVAQRRVGAGGSAKIATQRGLADALALLGNTVYAGRLAGASTLAAAEPATRDTVLWELRVLAGWMPATGTRLARAAAGAFERDNIVSLARRLDGGGASDPFDLGALALAWPRLRTVASTAELVRDLRGSPWGDPGSEGTIGLRDVLTLVWLRRLAAVAPAALPWAESACALIAARIVLVEGAAPSPRILQLARPLLGRSWETARTLAALRATLPRSVRPVLGGVETPEDLWRADAGLRGTVEADSFRLLRGSLPGPDVVLGAVAVLAMDAWRVRVALAAAATGAGASEVLDVVA